MDGEARDLRSVLVIGSGPIVIGQAAEFDYSGTQACRALKELGLRVILLNSNPATIMTDLSMADAVYMEPLTPEFAERVIARERPDGLLPTLGGQVGLNLAVALAEAGVLDRYGVRLLGTPLHAIETAEDRERFKAAMLRIGQPVPPSATAHDLDQALRIAGEIGYPVVVRPAFTLGGTGGGLAADEEQLRAVAARGLRASPVRQVLIEKSVAGWKEIEFEVMRDADDTCISVCGMENLDPVGIHTGDSIVVAPIQTLSDRVVQRLRAAALAIIRALQVEGGCNVQFAVHPVTGEYYVIEVNPRVSRSSALASKATGYPIAKIAAQIAAGRRLAEIRNPITGNTYAAFEPALDYVVVKIPRWPFDKFQVADRRLGTQMKATGEVMAIGRSFEEALLKAVRSLELGADPLRALRGESDEAILRRLEEATDDRLFALFEAFRRGVAVDEAARRTAIDPWFLHKIAALAAWERRLDGRRLEDLDAGTLRDAKRAGLPDAHLAALLGCGEDDVRERRRALGIRPVYKTVDSCAAEFPAETPYYYSAYEEEDEAPPSGRPAVLVLGSGPIRIGQGIEFDYCTVHAVWALRRAGYEAHIVNNNPETVSTDFDTADRLFFEPLTLEDVLGVVEAQRPVGVIPQFGGQTAINLAGPLAARGVRILGTPVEAIDAAEDRDKLDGLLARLGILRPPGGAAGSVEEALAVAARVGYPVLVRPSYVLGGRGMEVVHDPEELREYVARAARVTPTHPLWVDAYVPGREVEVDAVCDGRDVLIPGIMEHVERAGVHSGDSTAVYPPVTLSPAVKATLADHTARIARALGVVGLVNIQFVVTPDDRVYVLEVNPRASRTVPFLSKVTGVPMVELAVRCMLGARLRDLGHGTGLRPEPDFTAVKIAVFSWSKLTDVDVALGPEMKSTGEAIGLDRDYAQALRKAFLAAGYAVPASGALLCSVADRDKAEALPVIRGFARLGFRILATEGTAAFLERHGLAAERVAKLRQGRPNLVDRIRAGQVDLVLNTVSAGRQPWSDGFVIRRAAVEHGVPCLTSLDTAGALLTALERAAGREPAVAPLHEYLRTAARGELAAGARPGPGA